MSRTYSDKAFPHRILFDSGRDAQRGDDVKVLRRNVLERLDARAIERTVGPDDGVLRQELLRAAKTASHFLGAPDDWVESRSGVLVREQRIIVYPEKRTDGMLAAAEARMARLIADRRASAHTAEGRLSASDRSHARRIAVSAFRLAFEHRNVVHYTMSGARWQGIAERRRYADGRYPTFADCSSMYTWVLWNALTSVAGMDFPDVVNGAAWRAGYTGTMLAHGARVDSRMPGDAVLYGRAWPGTHVAMVADDPNFVYSHGSEAGPYYLRWNYRSDVLDQRRYIL